MSKNKKNKDGSVTLNCSNCSAPLVELWQRDPNVKKETTITAACAHCGDKSFKEVVLGSFYSGSTEFSDIDSMDIKDDRQSPSGISIQEILIKTTKAKEYE